MTDHIADAGKKVPDHSALIERLEAAEAGSQELELALECGLFGGEPGPALDRVYRKDGNGYGFTQAFAAYTRSLDAALALAERVLPGKFWTVYAAYRIEGRMTYGVNLDDDSDTSYSKTPALALCIAILKAKAQGEGG